MEWQVSDALTGKLNRENLVMQNQLANPGLAKIILNAPIYPQVFDVICLEFWIKFTSPISNN
jgi:hypothetical protein